MKWGSMMYAIVDKLLNTSVGSYLLTKLNGICNFIPPPRLDRPPKRNVLVIHAHPSHNSLSGVLLQATAKGLLDAGHEVRIRRLYFDPQCPDENYNGRTFPPLLQQNEVRMYAKGLINGDGQQQAPSDSQASGVTSTLFLAREVKEAISDLQWCNSIVFVYPTWWSSFPAVLKGYFDRVLLPGVAFKLQDSFVSKNYIPMLQHITKIGVVTTYHQSMWNTIVYGDNARRWISMTLKSFFSPDCVILWRGIYNVGLSDMNSEKIGDGTEKMTKDIPDDIIHQDSPMHKLIEETSQMFKHF